MIAGDRRNFLCPSFPAIIPIVFFEIAIKTEEEKIAVVVGYFFPFQRVGRPIVDLARTLAESATVDGEEAADRVVTWVLYKASLARAVSAGSTSTAFVAFPIQP